MRSDEIDRHWIGPAADGLRAVSLRPAESFDRERNEKMSEDKLSDDLYRRVEEHLQELMEPDLPEATLSTAERLELLEQAQASESCRELLESYEKTVSLLGSRPDVPVPEDFSRKVGESIDDSTPVIPFVRTERFQRLVGAAAAVALMTLVIWRILICGLFVFYTQERNEENYEALKRGKWKINFLFLLNLLDWLH